MMDTTWIEFLFQVLLTVVAGKSDREKGERRLENIVFILFDEMTFYSSFLKKKPWKQRNRIIDVQINAGTMLTFQKLTIR
jgi:hypothetical protein